MPSAITGVTRVVSCIRQKLKRITNSETEAAWFGSFLLCAFVRRDAENDPPLEFSVSDLVNWESGGQIQWKAPRKIVSIDQKDGEFFFQIEGLGVPLPSETPC